MFKRLFIILTLLAALTTNPTMVDASQVTGSIFTPSTGIPLKNATISFNLSQAGLDVAAGNNLANTPVNCFTSNVGAVVGLPDPQGPPNASQVIAGGSLSGVYYIKIAYYNGALITATGSALAVNVTGGNNAILVQGPALQPQGATGYKIYAGQTLDAETLQQTVSGFGNFTLLSLVGGAALPTNNTACALTFNDAIIPTDTRYRVNVVDVFGKQVAGFPQVWYLSGASINVGQVYPVATTGQVRFPLPVLSNPLSSYATQSINSPVTLNGFALTTGSLVLPNNTTPTACATGKGVIWEDGSGVLKACQNNGGTFSLIGGSAVWSLSGNYIIQSNLANQLLLGIASTDITDGGVTTNRFYYSVDGVSNANVIGMGLVTGSSIGTIAMGKTNGAGDSWPLVFRMLLSGATNNAAKITAAGNLMVNAPITATTLEGADPGRFIAVDGSLYTYSVVNNVVGGLTLDSGTSTFRISSTRVGSATPYAMAFMMFNTQTGVLNEAARFESVVDLAGTGRVHNLSIGTSGVSTYPQPLFVNRGQNASTDIVVRNATAGTASRATLNALSDGGTLTIGARSSSYNTGGLLPNQGFVYTNPGLVNGYQVYIDSTGGFTVYTNGTLRSTINASGLTLPSGTPLAVTSGGTGQSTAWCGGSSPCQGVLYATSPSVTSNSNALAYDVANSIFGLTGSAFIADAARHNPAGGTNGIHILYDNSGVGGLIASVNYTGPVYKPLLIAGSILTFNIAGVDAFYAFNGSGKNSIKFTGTVNTGAGAWTGSLASTTFPGAAATGSRPYTWLPMFAADGTLVWVPGWN